MPLDLRDSNNRSRRNNSPFQFPPVFSETIGSPVCLNAITDMMFGPYGNCVMGGQSVGELLWLCTPAVTRRAKTQTCRHFSQRHAGQGRQESASFGSVRERIGSFALLSSRRRWLVSSTFRIFKGLWGNCLVFFKVDDT